MNALSGDDIVLKQYHSPDRHYTAQFCDIAGNATVGFARNIKIIDQQDPLKDFKELFHQLLPGYYNYNFNADYIIMVLDGKPEVQLHWQNRKTLIVTYPKNAMVYSHDKQRHDIQIIYLTK